MASETGPDMSLLAELLEQIERAPPAIFARKLLVEHYTSIGWTEAAQESVQELAKLDPQDMEVQSILETLQTLQPSSAAETKTKAGSPSNALPSVPTSFLSRLFGKGNSEKKERQKRVQNVVKAMQKAKTKEEAFGIAFTDLETTAKGLSTSTLENNDDVREALAKRVKTLEAALGEELKSCATTAMMHFEHEILKRKYVGGETTMLGDEVQDIPRANFWVTEDGYAWDMEELAQAISSNGGVMRNPLSHQMFTTKDISEIVKHPLGAHLAAMAIEQKALKSGVRPQTIDRLAALENVLMDDDSADTIPSRQAVEDFMGFLATLPAAEQEALDKLRVPAVDSHTGKSFDTSIGQAIKDAQANRICFHKAGDLIGQAVTWLRKQ